MRFGGWTIRAAKPCVRLTKGVHLVFARTLLPVRESIVLADERGRIVFVMPHDRYVLVGTTDTDFRGRSRERHGPKLPTSNTCSRCWPRVCRESS